MCTPNPYSPNSCLQTRDRRTFPSHPSLWLSPVVGSSPLPCVWCFPPFSVDGSSSLVDGCSFSPSRPGLLWVVLPPSLWLILLLLSLWLVPLFPPFPSSSFEYFSFFFFFRGTGDRPPKQSSKEFLVASCFPVCFDHVGCVCSGGFFQSSITASRCHHNLHLSRFAVHFQSFWCSRAPHVV